MCSYPSMIEKIGKDTAFAAELLRKGELVAIPTETVYGLAANALNADAVLKIFEVKNRPFFDPLIIHVASFAEVAKYATDIPKWTEKAAAKFSPGPLTFVLRKHGNIPDVVTSGLETVAIRVPDHPLTLELLRRIDFPLAAPSANPFGYISPTSAHHVAEQLGLKIPYILDGGESAVGLESTIIGEENGVPTVYRLGGLSLEELRDVLGNVAVKEKFTTPVAPGSLEMHYAPRKPLYFDDRTRWNDFADEEKGLLVLSELSYKIPQSNQRILSTSGNLREAAKNLFNAMRSLDDEPAVQVIFADKMPEVGLGRAINDRLRRASVKH